MQFAFFKVFDFVSDVVLAALGHPRIPFRALPFLSVPFGCAVTGQHTDVNYWILTVLTARSSSAGAL
jgi:hypothetical protein